MTAAMILVALCLATTALASGTSVSGATFLPATDGLSCAGVCSQQGLTSAFLVGSSSGLQTSVCEANVTGLGQLSGYQQAGESACVIANNGAVQAFSLYSCLCLDSSAQGGLVSSSSTPCSSACNQGFDGLTGSAVSTDSSQSSYTCLPASEIGVSNRFGYTTQLDNNGVICTAALGNSAQATPEFSCYCSFSSGLQSGSSTASSPMPSTMPMPAADYSAVQSLSQDGDAISAGGRRLLAQ